MWDFVDTVLVVAGLGVLAWLWWTAGRTILDVSGRMTKTERIRAWFRLFRVPGVAALALVLVYLIQVLATGKR